MLLRVGEIGVERPFTRWRLNCLETIGWLKCTFCFFFFFFFLNYFSKQNLGVEHGIYQPQELTVWSVGFQVLSLSSGLHGHVKQWLTVDFGLYCSMMPMSKYAAVTLMVISLLDEETAGMGLGCEGMWHCRHCHCDPMHGSSILLQCFFQWGGQHVCSSPMSYALPLVQHRNGTVVPWVWRCRGLGLEGWVSHAESCCSALTLLYLLIRAGAAALMYHPPSVGNGVNAYWLCLYSVCSCQFSSIIQHT